MMELSNHESTIRVTCRMKKCPARGFEVFLIDNDGHSVSYDCTDAKGHAQLKIEREGNYRIKVKAIQSSNPKAQSRWIHLCPNQTANLDFFFYPSQSHKMLGRLKIILSDKNYPEYKLSEGVYKLWLTS